jgi:hypothetical protein
LRWPGKTNLRLLTSSPTKFEIQPKTFLRIVGVASGDFFAADPFRPKQHGEGTIGPDKGGQK